MHVKLGKSTAARFQGLIAAAKDQAFERPEASQFLLIEASCLDEKKNMDIMFDQLNLSASLSWNLSKL